MALYAFDGTWNTDDEDDGKDTNVVKFKELYTGKTTLAEGVGTRFGAIGHALGGILGAGGRSRIGEMYDALEENVRAGDRDVDVVGFSRGAALAVHFTNKIGEKGVEMGDGTRESVRVRFLGLWDVVGSFGLSFDTFINFQDINLGWDIDQVSACVDRCFHAMALDERRETFNVTRLDPGHRIDNVQERLFRGVHSDVGGGNRNPDRSNIALQWMLKHAIEAGLPIDGSKAAEQKYGKVALDAPISENKDPRRDPRRKLLDGDTIDPCAKAMRLKNEQSHTCRVLARLKYNWSRVYLEEGATYRFSVPAGDTWSDANIVCGPDGWVTERLPFIKEHLVKLFESRRRHPEANWFELIGAYGDEDDNLFRLGQAGSGQEYTAPRSGDLYLFANDLNSKYGNNEGDLEVTIERLR